MTVRTLSLEQLDRLNTLLTQASGIAGIASNQQSGDFVEANRHAMWCVADMLREATDILKGQPAMSEAMPAA